MRKQNWYRYTKEREKNSDLCFQCEQTCAICRGRNFIWETFVSYKFARDSSTRCAHKTDACAAFLRFVTQRTRNHVFLACFPTFIITSQLFDTRPLIISFVRENIKWHSTVESRHNMYCNNSKVRRIWSIYSFPHIRRNIPDNYTSMRFCELGLIQAQLLDYIPLFL